MGPVTNMELSPDNMANQLARILGGELLKTVSKPNGDGKYRLIGNLSTGIFAIVDSWRSDQAINNVRVFGNLSQEGSGHVRVIYADYRSERPAAIPPKVAQLISSGNPIVPWWSVHHQARFDFENLGISESDTEINHVLFSRFKEHKASPQFGFGQGTYAPHIAIPRPGELIIENIAPTFIRHDTHPVLYRVHLDEPYFTPLSVELPFSRLEQDPDEVRHLSQLAILFPVDQLEQGNMSPDAGLVSIKSRVRHLASAENPPVGYVGNVIASVADDIWMPLALALESYGTNIGVSAMLSDLGLQFFHDGIPILQEAAVLKLSREFASQSMAPFREERSKAVDDSAPVQIVRGGIVISSREDLVKAISALAGYNEKTGNSIPELAPDVRELEDSGQIQLAQLAAFGQSITPPATRTAIEAAVDELMKDVGEQVHFPFDCAGHLSDGTQGVLNYINGKSDFPALLSFHGGGYGDSLQGRVSQTTGLSRNLKSIEFRIPFDAPSNHASLHLVNFKPLFNHGYEIPSESYSLSLVKNDELPVGLPVEIKIEPEYYKKALGEVEAGVMGFIGKGSDPSVSAEDRDPKYQFHLKVNTFTALVANG